MTKHDVTYQEKINELRLDISHPNSGGLVFVLVEGESDIRLFRKFFDLTNCKVETVPGGNPKVEEAVKELLSKSEYVIGIRDADFIHLNQESYSKQNLFLTDYHDMEMSLVAQDEVLNAIAFEYLIPKEQHSGLRSKIFGTIEKISLLKWLNVQENLKLNFKDVGFQDLLYVSSSNWDFQQYFKRVISKSPDAQSTDYNAIEQKINQLKGLNPDVYQLCNGHDFIKAFASFLRKKSNTKSVSEITLSSLFRTNYTVDFYQTTDTFKQTKAWAESVERSIYTQKISKI